VPKSKSADTAHEASRMPMSLNGIDEEFIFGYFKLI
jgi:hypothetical protein